MAGRSRIFVRAEALPGQGENIDVQFAVPFNATFLQLLFKVSAVPTMADILTLGKNTISVTLSPFVIRTYSPVALNVASIICNDHFEYKKDDILIVSYANTDNLAVGVECVLREGD